MNTIGRRSLAGAFALALIFGMSAMASAQQQAPDAQTQQTAPVQPGPSKGHEMMQKGMEHGKMGQEMGRKGMEGEHGKMGSGMKQSGSAPTNDSTGTTGANPSTPSSGSK